ncbi:MAG: GIY-YIG nuclease family protein [Selenomonadaceae bacterium]|nr:GIY-YIG nuclease family protein [Selenomonadaceae bacterium]
MNHSKKDVKSQTPPLFSVYVIWCRQTNMHYVGVTGQESVYKRIRQHRRGKQFVDKEIKRIGWEGNWDYWVVEENVPSNRITEREQYWVGVFNSVFPHGYNKTIGGIKHFKHSKKTCKQMGKSHLGKKRAPFTDEHKANLSKSRTGEKNPNYGKPARNRGVPCPEEAKSKIRKKLTGRKRPDQSERMKGENNPNFGKPMPEETKAKLREKALTRDVSSENNPMYGKHHTEEAIAKIRAKALARYAAKRAAKAVAEENLAAANSTPTSLSTLSDAVIFQQSLSS